MKMICSAVLFSCAVASFLSIASTARAQLLTGMLPFPQPREAVTLPPGSRYVWVDGEWVWNNGWVWLSGHWAFPPYPNAVWVPGCWMAVPRGYYRVPGHWH